MEQNEINNLNLINIVSDLKKNSRNCEILEKKDLNRLIDSRNEKKSFFLNHHSLMINFIYSKS